MIYADFESILVPENNGKQNPDDSYTNNQNQCWLQFGYKIICADDQFVKFLKSYLDQDAVHKVITNKVRER